MIDYIARLKNLSDGKLIDVVKNYRQYGYDENMRTSALSLLENRGITKKQLELTGNLENKNYDYAGRLYNANKKNSKIAFLLLKRKRQLEAELKVDAIPLKNSGFDPSSNGN